MNATAGRQRTDRSHPAGRSVAGFVIGLCLLAAAPPALRAQTGTLDMSFAPVITGVFFAQINAMIVQTNDQILFGGSFTNVSGAARSGIARLNADGSVDQGFDPGTGISGGLNSVNAIAVQSNDGSVWIGGDFTKVNGTNRTRVARLNSNGSLDAAFNPGTGPNNTVKALAAQPDGSILIAGRFTSVNGKNRGSLARLSATGSLDTNFVSGVGADAEIDTLALQSDGKIIIGGRFTHFNGTSQARIARLNGADGSLDSSFNIGPGANDFVNAVLLQPDGKILVGGGFTNINTAGIYGIARLETNGIVDANFTTGLDYFPFGSVFSVAIQSNGKIFTGGNFTSVEGVSRPSFARLNADGTLDAGFVPDPPNSAVVAVGLQSDGSVILAGGMAVGTQFGVARLHGDPVSPPARPALSNAELLTGGQFHFILHGEAGRSYIILTTPDFSSWSPLATQILATASQPFTDSSAASTNNRFYRTELSP